MGTPIIPAVLEVVSLLEQMNTSLGTLYAAIDVANNFFILSVSKEHLKYLARPAKIDLHYPAAQAY